MAAAKLFRLISFSSSSCSSSLLRSPLGSIRTSNAPLLLLLLATRTINSSSFPHRCGNLSVARAHSYSTSSAADASAEKEPSEVATGRGVRSSDVEVKKGDWFCPKCNFLNFARNRRCLECKEEGPELSNFGNIEMKYGDWICPRCKYMNFARNQSCIRCQVERPKSELNPGDWFCPSCNFLNFKRNKVCKKCNCDSPGDKENRFDDDKW